MKFSHVLSADPFNVKRRALHAQRMADDPEYRERVRAANRSRAQKAKLKSGYKERVRARAKRRQKDPAYRAYRSRWMLAHAQRRRAEDPSFRVIHALRVRLHRAVGSKRPSKTKDMIGCSPAELRAHLEAQFKPGMTWDNHGVKGWHIDHKRALSTFNLVRPDGSIDADEMAKATHYTNLQPLWYWENCAKGASLSA